MHMKNKIFKCFEIEVFLFPQRMTKKMELFHEIFCNFSRGANLSALENWWWRWDRMVVIIYGGSENPRKIIKDSNFYPPFDFGN